MRNNGFKWIFALVCCMACHAMEWFRLAIFYLELCAGSGLVPRPKAKHRVSDSPIHRSNPAAVGNYATLFRLPAAALLRVTDKP